MKSVRMLMAGTVAVAGLSLGLAGTADAQGAKAAGVVTSLQGTANLQRVVSATETTPQVQPLKFRDNVFVQDRITTGDQSLARILLGGKAVVTVREHSSLTITSTSGTETIDITAGKIALAVAKERMSPGERIDIKTPNAVAGVRGTVVIAEVSQVTASAAEQSGGVNTRFTLLTGLLDVNLLDPSGRRGAAFTLNPLQTLSLTGFTPPPGGPRSITPQQGQQAANDYKVGLKDAPQGSNAQISDRQVEQASNAAAASGGGPGTGATVIIDKTNNNGTTGGCTSPGCRLPPNCTNNCSAPPSNVNNGKSGIPPECRGTCPSEGRPPLRRAATR